MNEQQTQRANLLSDAYISENAKFVPDTQSEIMLGKSFLSGYTAAIDEGGKEKLINPKFIEWKKKNYYEDAGGFYKYGSNEKSGNPDITIEMIYNEWLDESPAPSAPEGGYSKEEKRKTMTDAGLLSSCLSEALGDLFDTYSDKEIHRFHKAMKLYSQSQSISLSLEGKEKCIAFVQYLLDEGVIADFWDTNNIEKYFNDFLTSLTNK